MGNIHIHEFSQYCRPLTEVLQKCNPGSRYWLEVEPDRKHTTEKKEVVTITLRKNGQIVASVTINIYNVDEHADNFMRFVKNPALLPRPVKIGQIDSFTDRGESSGYNRLLRTVGYNMIHDVCKCKIMTTWAVNAVSLHILSKYFHWDFEAGIETMVEYQDNKTEEEAEDDLPLIDVYSPRKERQRENIRQLLKKSKPAGPLLKEIRRALLGGDPIGPSYNACVDLTDPDKLAAMRFMLDQVNQCKCPPCENFLDPPKTEAAQKALLYRKRRVNRKARTRTSRARKPLIRRASSTRKPRYSQPRRRRAIVRNPLRANK